MRSSALCCCKASAALRHMPTAMTVAAGQAVRMATSVRWAKADMERLRLNRQSRGNRSRSTEPLVASPMASHPKRPGRPCGAESEDKWISASGRQITCKTNPTNAFDLSSECALAEALHGQTLDCRQQGACTRPPCTRACRARRACRALPGTRGGGQGPAGPADRKSTRLNSSHSQISYAVFCLKKK